MIKGGIELGARTMADFGLNRTSRAGLPDNEHCPAMRLACDRTVN